MKKALGGLFLALACALAALPALADPMAPIDREIAAHPGQTGVYVLETGAEALVARAWLADGAQRSIEVQYFIWSTDNIGILAAEALLRAAERGVRVRVIVDDMLIDAPAESMLALARHPNVDIRIYNPKVVTGVPLHMKLLNAVTDFHGVNQRMHDKTFIVDGKVAITGGRNMAAEYYDYNREYNFRDRDALLMGEAVRSMQASFERFWASPRVVGVEKLFGGLGIHRRHGDVDDADAVRVFARLHEYARDPENFSPEVRAAIAAAPASFPQIVRQIAWGPVEFIADSPGKNPEGGFSAGGLTTAALARLVRGAKSHIVIQSPYLVLSDKAFELFAEVRRRGVRVRINTNSLASTDNIHAFSGYRNQRQKLLAMGLEIFEYKPDPEAQKQLLRRAAAQGTDPPVFAVHAKSMVVDSKLAYIGTFNFDPRSENLNTEVGVIVHDEKLARAVEAAIEIDMAPGNSWNAATDAPDRHVSLRKRGVVRFWQMMPMKPLL